MDLVCINPSFDNIELFVSIGSFDDWYVILNRK